MLGCYTDRLSVRPLERFTLLASAEGPSRLQITRIGGTEDVVLTQDGVATQLQPVPENVDRDGCGWATGSS